MRRFVVVMTLAAAFAAAPVYAQDTAAADQGVSSSTQKKPPAKPAKPRAPREPVGVRVFGLFDIERMAARQSFETITGSPIVFGYGGGVDILNVWSGLFIRGSVALASKSGTRAIVFDNEIFETEFAIDIGKRAIEIGAGWRFSPPKSRTATYAGGGLLFVSYSETSPDVGDAEDVRETFRGWFVMAGAEFRIGSRGFFGVEGHYRTVPDALGSGGVSAALGETDLGGIVGRVMFGVRFP
jgi:hypothetical protein